MAQKLVLTIVLILSSLIHSDISLAATASESQEMEAKTNFVLKELFPTAIFGDSQKTETKTNLIPVTASATVNASESKKAEIKKNVLILCYHQFHVGTYKDTATSAANAYSVSVTNFKRQLEQIKKENYTVIPINDYIDYLAGKKDIPERSVIITIDDGYKSAYTYAYPLLKSYKYPFTVYVYSNWINTGTSSMTWDEIKDMEKSGLATIGSHSRSHPYFTKPAIVDSPKYKEILRDEIYNSKIIIEKELGHKITTFAYPYGAYNEDAILEVIKAGYNAAVSVKSGINDSSRDEWTMNRMIIRSDTTLSKFIAILNHYPIGIDYALLTPYDGQIIQSASFSLSMNITNYQVLSNTPKFYINGVDHTHQLDLSKVNNGIITGSISGYKKGYNMITILSNDKATGGFREASWSFFAK